MVFDDKNAKFIMSVTCDPSAIKWNVWQ